ncbi:lichenicidin A2 family type 2 lantibiotic [Bacillus sonorensis]|uniref:mersacidin family lantibiotic n=1 Tax=Bacillus sonorensis TaxID=119858 RepID=UPI0004979E77|nr:lichenicidin A2 family type 2 lantibiotic [Bacillus sonorensis]MCY8090035.1 lichenicidin A2 family type 2 lantibiotic [Bacillus sonorensis]MCZ0067075.1 lichenicidin A2 family type 2 lantibiotic [Bacillus sonorensis]MCZ0095605.1 lichenicidin A2 family type 2 lantibiotic [Bacillus sonorensis]MEC1354945.1 lichenicidin A2 family type 2 lantibiotic [Bacillus sonorensis]MEC1427147.1 lichenicidin A2 family type 2 lantibiotic [Bacillus sonorensis]
MNTNEKKDTTLSVTGPSFEELTMEEMASIQGCGDVKPETTPVCVAGFTIGLGGGSIVSAIYC